MIEMKNIYKSFGKDHNEKKSLKTLVSLFQRAIWLRLWVKAVAVKPLY